MWTKQVRLITDDGVIVYEPASGGEPRKEEKAPQDQGSLRGPVVESGGDGRPYSSGTMGLSKWAQTMGYLVSPQLNLLLMSFSLLHYCDCDTTPW